MAGILRVDSLQNEAANITIPVTYLPGRLLQRKRSFYYNGSWNPGNTYYPLPGSWIDFTPMDDDSIIKYTFIHGTGHRGRNSFNIFHYKFYVNGGEYARHTESNNHQESGHAKTYEVQSWGKGIQGNMGFASRQYSDNNHCTHFHRTNYWNGGGSDTDMPAQVIVEERTLG